MNTHPDTRTRIDGEISKRTVIVSSGRTVLLLPTYLPTPSLPTAHRPLLTVRVLSYTTPTFLPEKGAVLTTFLPHPLLLLCMVFLPSPSPQFQAQFYVVSPVCLAAVILFGSRVVCCVLGTNRLPDQKKDR